MSARDCHCNVRGSKSALEKMRPTVLLFDVDGTLVDTAGAGRRAISHAFEVLYDRVDACAALRFGGRTDRWIARNGLIAIEREPSESEIDRVLEVYLTELPLQLERTAACRVLPGVSQLLEELSVVEQLGIGLGTGNVRRGAQAKLTRLSLWHHFSFGGFGCDHEERNHLLRVGADRGAELLGLERSECRVVVIGDTPRDVEAAHAIGAECLAVATGGFSVDELRNTGALVVVTDLQARAALDFLLS